MKLDEIMYDIKLKSSACIIQLYRPDNSIEKTFENNPINTLTEHFSLAKKFVFLVEFCDMVSSMQQSFHIVFQYATFS